MSAVPVEVRGLVKRYGSAAAVDRVDLTVEPGDIYGYLGPNGAGKTTTLRMLLGLIRRDGGDVSLFGRDPAQGIDGRENLQLLGALDGGADRQRIEGVLEQVDLRERARDRVGTYSLGMRQRLGIAAALLREPRLLILDEPANGLDPAGMRDMRTLISGLPERGVTVLYSSHLLAEVEEVCNRVAIVNDGRIAFEGKLEELRASFGISYRLQTTDDAAARRAAVELGVVVQGAGAALSLDASRDAIDRLTIELGRRGIAIRQLTQEQRSLEDLFFQVTEDAP
jgi:ABC-2 type transport system ATP-binding protein